MSQTNVDPITLTVVWNGLLAIAEEMGSTLRRTAFSEAVREGEDFSTGVFDRNARLIAQGNFTPGHLGSMPYVVRTVLEYFPIEDLKPGDAVLLNDSFLGSGHFPDCFLVSPAFLDGKIIGFVCTTAHHIDVGGAAPGSQKVHGVTEAFQEGVRILPIRLIREGKFDNDILRLILGNVRAPEKVQGDLRAQANANRAGVVRLETLNMQYGRDVTEAAYDAILERSEIRMRELISKMPDGVYSFDDQMDDYGPGTPPIKVAVDVTIKGDDIEVDFSRSSDQVPAALNSYINYTRAYTFFAVKVY
ncbi:MAG: hydantoinase B/oxoprolinase family protein, partial [Rhodospirillales bacterium]